MEIYMHNQLTILSFGGGQDSTVLLLMMIYNQHFRKKYAPNDLIVVMSDTGNEHKHTYEHTKKMGALCQEHSIPFFFLTGDMGYHSPFWVDLVTAQTRSPGKYKPTMIQTNTHSCTDSLKLGPIYKFIDEYINTAYYNDQFTIAPTRGVRKKALKKFYEDYGYLKVLIGFAKGEERRVHKSINLQNKQRQDQVKKKEKGLNGGWEHIIDRVFPLIDLGMSRSDCIKYIETILPY
jgi:3'-phosphoadenosine 5'-phosphosulfate sulfotransferase (PAPS reductase)/FAD synthetase